VVPAALRREREGRSTHCVGCAGEIKSLRHPPASKSTRSLQPTRLSHQPCDRMRGAEELGRPPMTREDLRVLLNKQNDVEFVEREVLGRCPWIFGDEKLYEMWRRLVADQLGLANESVWIVGSGATGYSLSPFKPGRPFRALTSSVGATSDIDIALVAPEVFASAWDTILTFDRLRRLGGSIEDREKIRRDVYWGLVGQQSIPLNTGAARTVITAMAAAGRTPPIRGYPLRCRIYRRLEDLRAYHVNSLRQLRVELDAFGG